MASTTKQLNDSATNGNSGKRKKTRGNKGSYLSKWLDKSMHQTQDSTPSMDTYDSFANLNWQGSQFAPAFDPCRFMYTCAEPMSLPTLPTYYNPPMMGPVYGPEYRYSHKNAAIQRSRQRRRDQSKPEELNAPTGIPNGSLNKNYAKIITDSQDFASLPPIVTSVGDTTSNSDMYTNDKDEGNNNKRRYSDPCVQELPDVAQAAKGEVESSSDVSSTGSGSQVGGRLLSCLIDQITTLKMNNERLNKELQETKAELNCIRQQSTIWQKSSSSSLGGTPNHSPLNNNGIGVNYTPGILSELVREIRDAARLREEALYSRVRAMLIERAENGLTTPDSKLSDRNLEDIKSSLRASEADKRRMMERINKLEDELRALRVVSGLETNDKTLTNGNLEDPEAERVRLRKEVVDMRRAKHTAEEHALKLERTVTQLRSKFNGIQLSPSGPESLPSESEQDPKARVRRTSSSNSTVVFGPVTDL